MLHLSTFMQEAKAQQVISLYKEPIPGAKEKLQPREHADPTNPNVSGPTLTIYQPEQSRASGAAVIICPGGGYQSVVVEKEGHKIAAEFVRWGITAFVLHYRLPDKAKMDDPATGPLQDAQQAIRLLRQRAAEWQISPDRIGLAGFSAGGHLAASAGTLFNWQQTDAQKTGQLRPDFMILVYPVISFEESITHKGSRNRLVGESPSPDQLKRFSLELQVSPQTPPTFLVHAGDDDKVPVQHSLLFYEALNKHAVPAEMHIYPSGGHGFALNVPEDHWPELCRKWLQRNGWIQ